MGNNQKKIPSCFESTIVHTSIIFEPPKSVVIDGSLPNNLKQNEKNPKIIWHDPKIFTQKENTKFYDDYLKVLNVDRFDNYKEANQMILDSKDSTFIVMTSGTDGEKFVKMIHDQPNVLQIIIFCQKTNLHKEWAQDFKKIVSVTNSKEKAHDELMKISKPEALISNDLNKNKNNEINQKVIVNNELLKKKKITETKAMPKKIGQKIDWNQCKKVEVSSEFLEVEIEDQKLDKKNEETKNLSDHKPSKINENKDLNLKKNIDISIAFFENEIPEVTEKKELTMKITNTPPEVNERKYIELSNIVVKEFWRVILNYMATIKKNTSFKDESILDELCTLNPKNASEIQNIFELKKKEILKAILYLYSTNHIYKEFNGELQKGLYKNLLNTLTLTAQNLLSNENYSNLYHSKGAVLYRGIKDSNKFLQEYDNYIKNKIKPLYFPAFVSTTSNLNVAKSKRFSDGVILEIHLSKKNPHPHIMLVDQEWSEYPQEKETLLYSYFPFFVDKIYDLEGKFKVITLIQDESQVVFSNNIIEMKQYWNVVIKETLEKEKNIVLPKNIDIIEDILEIVEVEKYDEKVVWDSIKTG